MINILYAALGGALGASLWCRNRILTEQAGPGSPWGP